LNKDGYSVKRANNEFLKFLNSKMLCHYSFVFFAGLVGEILPIFSIKRVDENDFRFYDTVRS
jgi:hypothetical protein